MKYTMTEKKVLKKLGIPDFKHMTKDKVVKFASMLPNMDPEIAKACIAQFPEFKELATSIVIEYKQMVVEAIKSNEKSQEAYYNACNNIIDALQRELENPEITSEDRDRIEDKMIVVAGMIGEKDSENKKFILKILGTVGLAVVGVTAAAAAVLGASSSLNTNALDDSSDDDDDEDIIDMDDIE